MKKRPLLIRRADQDLQTCPNFISVFTWQMEAMQDQVHLYKHNVQKMTDPVWDVGTGHDSIFKRVEDNLNIYNSHQLNKLNQPDFQNRLHKNTKTSNFHGLSKSHQPNGSEKTGPAQNLSKAIKAYQGNRDPNDDSESQSKSQRKSSRPHHKMNISKEHADHAGNLYQNKYSNHFKRDPQYTQGNGVYKGNPNQIFATQKVNFHSNPSKQNLEPEKSNFPENVLTKDRSITNHTNGKIDLENLYTLEEIMKNPRWLTAQESPEPEDDQISRAYKNIDDTKQMFGVCRTQEKMGPSANIHKQVNLYNARHGTTHSIANRANNKHLGMSPIKDFQYKMVNKPNDNNLMATGEANYDHGSPVPAAKDGIQNNFTPGTTQDLPNTSSTGNGSNVPQSPMICYSMTPTVGKKHTLATGKNFNSSGKRRPRFSMRDNNVQNAQNQPQNPNGNTAETCAGKDSIFHFNSKNSVGRNFNMPAEFVGGSKSRNTMTSTTLNNINMPLMNSLVLNSSAHDTFPEPKPKALPTPKNPSTATLNLRSQKAHLLEIELKLTASPSQKTFSDFPPTLPPPNPRPNPLPHHNNGSPNPSLLIPPRRMPLPPDAANPTPPFQTVRFFGNKLLQVLQSKILAQNLQTLVESGESGE